MNRPYIRIRRGSRPRAIPSSDSPHLIGFILKLASRPDRWILRQCGQRVALVTSRLAAGGTPRSGARYDARDRQASRQPAQMSSPSSLEHCEGSIPSSIPHGYGGSLRNAAPSALRPPKPVLPLLLRNHLGLLIEEEIELVCLLEQLASLVVRLMRKADALVIGWVLDA